MFSYRTSILRRSLPCATIKHLRDLWQRMAELVGEEAVILTEDVLRSVDDPPERAERFTVLVSKQFSALLVAADGGESQEKSLIEVGLTFETEAIAAFLNQLALALGHNARALNALKRASLMLQPNDATFQSEFTLSLVEILSANKLEIEPEPVYSCISGCEPTDRTQLYAQLQQQKQTLEQRAIERTQELHDALDAARAASLAKSEFLAAMSHELRTPLTCVIGLSATLLHSFGDRTANMRVPPQKQRDYLQTIYDSGEHLLELIDDILDLSQVEAGKAILNVSEFSLTKLAKQSLQTLKEKASLKGVKLLLQERVNLQQDLAGSAIDVDRFRADRRRVKQILLNLLSNAVKFTLEGGRVILRVWREDNTAVFQVEDTGIGISEHHLPLIFDKFQQLDRSYNRIYEGTGLGLALTKQLVELHRGRIEVESTLGAGSTFTVWLPDSRAVKDEGSRIKDEQEDLSFTLDPSYLQKGSIVLVEEHEEVAVLICNILAAAGYQVVWLIDSSSAVGKIKVLQPIIAIVDARSQQFDVSEICHSLHTLPTTQHIKILVLTEAEMSQNNERFLAAGADDCLLLPVQPEQLLYKIAVFASAVRSNIKSS